MAEFDFVKEEYVTVNVKEECVTVNVKEECVNVDVKEECVTVDVKEECMDEYDPSMSTSLFFTGKLCIKLKYLLVIIYLYSYISRHISNQL